MEKSNGEVHVYPGNDAILSIAAQMRSIYCSEDVLQDPNYNPSIDRIGACFVRNVACIPLYDTAVSYDTIDTSLQVGSTPESMVALLYLVNKNERYGTFFTGQDVSNLMMMLQSCGSTIQAQQNLCKQRNHLSALSSLASSSAFTLEEFPEHVKQIVAATTCTIWIMTSTESVCQYSSAKLVPAQSNTNLSQELPNQSSCLALNLNSIMGHCILKKEVMQICNWQHDSRFNPKVDECPTHTNEYMLCVPILRRNGNAIGAMQVLSMRSFDERDRQILDVLRATLQFALETKPIA